MAITAMALYPPADTMFVPSRGSTAMSTVGVSAAPTSSPMYSMGASSRSPSPTREIVHGVPRHQGGPVVPLDPVPERQADSPNVPDLRVDPEHVVVPRGGVVTGARLDDGKEHPT